MSPFLFFALLLFFFVSFPPSIIADRCGGNLAMVYRDPAGPSCFFSHLDPKNGFLFNVSHINAVCADRDVIPSSSIPITAFDRSSRSFFFTSGSGEFVWIINNLNGNATKFAALPIEDNKQYAQIIGMHIVVDSDGVKKLMIVTVKNILVAPILPADSSININHPSSIEKHHRRSKTDCKKRHNKQRSPILLSPSSFTERLSLVDFKINGDDLSTATTDTVFIISSSRILYKINFTQSVLGKAIKSMPKIDRLAIKSSNDAYPIRTIMDLQYYPKINYTDGSVIEHQLVIVDSYRLFIMHQQNNQVVANYATAIPDGPGFPRTNAIGGDLFFFADFSHIFSIDLLNNYTISKPANFNSYFSQGLFHYFF